MKVLMLEAGARVDPAKDFHHRFSVPDGLPRPGQARPDAPLRGQRAQLPDHARQRREPVHDVAGHGLSLGTVAVPRRPHAALGARHRSHGRLRVQGRLARRLRHGLGRLLRRHEAVLRPHRELHRRERRALENCRSFPTASFLPPMPLNCAETIFTAASKSLGWPSTHRRLAQLTRPHNGRPACHYCGNCVNGCDVGAMFNSDRGDAAAGAEDRQPRDPHRQRRRARAHEQGEPRAGRDLHRARTRRSRSTSTRST